MLRRTLTLLFASAFAPVLVWAGGSCVNDDTGAAVCAHNPQRVLSLSPHLTETVAFVGGLGRLIAVDESSDFPAQIQGIKKLPAPWLLGVEAVLAERPDLVLVWKSGFPQKTVEQLRRSGVPVFVSEPQNLAGVADTQRRLAALLGLERQALGPIQRWQQDIQMLREKHAGRPKVAVFYQVWPQPLMTLGGGHVITELIELCGGRNVFSANPSLSFVVNVESVLARKPELLLSSGNAQTLQRLQAQWSNWPSLPAVAHGQVQVFPQDILVRNGPRLLQAGQHLCAMLDAARQQN